MQSEWDMTEANEQDIEQLELYLDRELAAADVTALESRLNADATLRGELERLRGQRGRRLAAMSFAYDTDSATVQRLVASVRTAQASEAIARRRQSTGWLRPAMSAAACIAFGLGLGIILHKQHAGDAPGGNGAAVSAGFVGGGNSGANTDISFPNVVQPQGVYIVSIRDADRNEVLRIAFPSQQAAQSYIDQFNNRARNGVPSLNVSENAQMSQRPY